MLTGEIALVIKTVVPTADISEAERSWPPLNYEERGWGPGGREEIDNCMTKEM